MTQRDLGDGTPNSGYCKHCGKRIWQSIPNPSYWTHEHNGSDRCLRMGGTKAALEVIAPASLRPGSIEQPQRSPEARTQREGYEI